jgi:hypothetical protein
VAPHIAAAVPAKFGTQTAGTVTVTGMVPGSTTDATAKMTAAKTVTTATMTAAARKCGASENKDNCKSDDGVSQH